MRSSREITNAVWMAPWDKRRITVITNHAYNSYEEWLLQARIRLVGTDSVRDKWNMEKVHMRDWDLIERS